MTREMDVGSDWVWTRGEAVVVESPQAMADWKVTRYRRTAILFEGRTYFVAGAGETPDGLHVYVLEPWPDGLHDRPRTVLRYDAAYARVRDTRRGEASRADRILAALTLVGPLVGLLPRRLKRHLHEHYGLDPLVATRQSVFAEYLAMLGLGSLSVIGTFTQAFGDALIGLLVSCVVVGADWLARSHALAGESLDQPGFYEWLFNWEAGDRPRSARGPK